LLSSLLSFVNTGFLIREKRCQ